MIERVEVSCDEDGFHLILRGEIELAGTGAEHHFDLTVETLDLLLGQDAALQLLAETREKIGEWAAEGEAVRADFERYQRTGDVPEYVRDPDTGLPITGWGIDHDRSHPEEAQRLAADLERKRRKENP